MENNLYQLVLAVGMFLRFLQNYYDFVTPPGGRVQKSTHGLPFWEKCGKCRVQVNPRDPNFGQFWSTPGTPNWPKSVPDLMGHYQGAYGRLRSVRVTVFFCSVHLTVKNQIYILL
jgi:hypothetical protein